MHNAVFKRKLPLGARAIDFFELANDNVVRVEERLKIFFVALVIS